MKTGELTGAALDWIVTHLEGVKTYGVKDWLGQRPRAKECRWSTNWEQGGPIIDIENIGLIPPHDDIEDWEAYHPTRIHNEEYGPHPLIAAMRCYVASKLGDEVEIPKELI